ncbi:MAG: hypothetical protein ACN4G0_01765 [Polyangiales bacterium]
MTHRSHGGIWANAALVCIALALFGCQSSNTPPSSVVGGYTFTHDFEGERKVLRIEEPNERDVACMQVAIPEARNAVWRKAALDSAVHRQLLQLMFDPTREPRYREDSDLSEKADILVCTVHGDGTEACYLSRAVVTGVDLPLYFGLHPDVTLSAESEELIAAFLNAHEACWDADSQQSS